MSSTVLSGYGTAVQQSQDMHPHATYQYRTLQGPNSKITQHFTHRKRQEDNYYHKCLLNLSNDIMIKHKFVCILVPTSQRRIWTIQRIHQHLLSDSSNTMNHAQCTSIYIIKVRSSKSQTDQCENNSHPKWYPAIMLLVAVIAHLCHRMALMMWEVPTDWGKVKTCM